MSFGINGDVSVRGPPRAPVLLEPDGVAIEEVDAVFLVLLHPAVVYAVTHLMTIDALLALNK